MGNLALHKNANAKGNIKAKAPGEAVIKTTITLYSKKTKTVETRVKVSP